jgi:DNA polymerase-3 subunit epsilon
VVKIENGKYIGFGYVDVSELNFVSELLHDCIKSYPDNRDVHQIIKRYLKKNRVEKIITF